MEHSQGKYYRCILLICWLIVTVAGGDSNKLRKLKELEDVEAVTKGGTTFTANLYRALKRRYTGNLVMSPFTLTTTLSLVKLGSGGGTAEEIEKVCGSPHDEKILISGLSKIHSSYSSGSTEGYELTVANRLFPNSNSLVLKEDYVTQVKRLMDGIRPLNFTDNVAAAQQINDWVTKVTRGKIKQLISQDSLTNDTMLVLVNGIYFKGVWKHQFDPKETKKMPFHLSDRVTAQVDMMYLYSAFPNAYLDELDVSAVTLPYKGGRLNMIVYVPENITGLSRLEEGLKNFSPASIQDRMVVDWKLNFYLPKFKIQSSLKLEDTLKSMGLGSIFKQPDFTKMTHMPLAVSQVIQKTVIEVNEEGSEAAAATGMDFYYASAAPPTVVADRPFLFQIVDTFTDIVLFTGRVTNPLEIESQEELNFQEEVPLENLNQIKTTNNKNVQKTNETNSSGSAGVSVVNIKMFYLFICFCTLLFK